MSQEQKTKQKFRINGKSIVYEGLVSTRAKDLMDILAKMEMEDDKVVPTFRENIPGDASSDGDVMAFFEEAKRVRRERKSRKAAGDNAANPEQSAAFTPAQSGVDFTTSSAAPSSVYNAPPPAVSTNSAAPSVVARTAAPEEKQRLTLVFKSSKFAYEGFPSKKETALFELLLKQSDVTPDLLVKTYRDNLPENSGHSDEQILQLFEEAKRAKQLKEEGKKQSIRHQQQQHQQQPQATAGGESSQQAVGSTSAATTAAAAQSASPRSAATLSAIDEISSMSTKEKDVINDFINSVLSSAPVSVATAATAPQSGSGAAGTGAGGSPPSSAAANGNAADRPGAGANLAPRPSVVADGPKIAVYCQEEGSTTQRIIYTGKNCSFVDFSAMVEKKIGRKVALSFNEGEDKIEIDDDDVLQMFFELQGDGRKLRLICSNPATRRVVTDDILTEAQATTTAMAPSRTASNAATASAQRPAQFNASGVVCVKEMRTFTGHSAAVYCCAFSPSAEKFCTASRDRSVRVWNTATGTCTVMKGGHNGFVLSCDFSPSGNFIVSSADDCSLKVWNVSNGAKTLSLKGHDDKVYCCQYNSTGAYIVSGSCDRTVRVWNADSGAKQATLKGHDLAVFSCCFSNTDVGRFVASGSDDRLVKVWDWREAREVKNFIGHTGTVWSVQFSHHDKFIISASMDHELKLWDVASASCIRTMTGHMTPIHHAIFSTNDRYILSCARDWSVMVWDTETGKHLETLQGHRNTVYHLAMKDDMLLTSSLDDSIKLWSFKETGAADGGKPAPQ